MLTLLVLLAMLCGPTPKPADDCDSNCIIQQGSGSGN